MWFVCGATGECFEIGELRGSVGRVLDPEIRRLAFPNPLCCCGIGL
jgi:hypothetical protein